MLRPLSPRRAALARRRLTAWSRLWGVPDLGQHLLIAYSTRLARSLGRCQSSTSTLLLHPALDTLDAGWFTEVLCHEAAHVACARLSPRTARPHGEQWQRLMRLAGYLPRVRLQPPPGFPARRARAACRYEHFCPVCQWVRFAARPMSRWRCADCVAAGLDGRLAVVPA